ncbi:hypothetical protein HJC23_008184 [Cyclotella cryptica]|uniref:DDE Tnp4 domain-containing protein n=1 Tax=Cyclotella cryptica TaxID=29204 RepID=A0ABD3P6H4_9STRA|eukprot:CCRYP_017572-RA/>CCRYP_017572-RA protein AED:0.20 eAED:0.20 QI:0/-1/0/1/-1/0/1/0/300
MTPQFNIFYPESLEAQRRIAARYEKSSTPKINNCAGAIDGILIWTTKPSLAEAKSSGIDQKKYLCGRKHKFEFNCQAVSDAQGRFLDVSIIYGGSTSDCLAFEGSDLYKRCTQGLMKQDFGKLPFVLFGDNAYLNSSFMATPYPNVSNDPGKKTKELRIRVECAFGMLVHRWGILCSAFPQNIKTRKVIATVIVLTKLHNFCIDESNNSQEILPSLEVDNNVLINRDDSYVEMVGVNKNETALPTDLMNGGHHYNDVPTGILRVHLKGINQVYLPLTMIHNFIAKGQWERPQMGTKNRNA